MATDMGNKEKISGVDLVALEAKYVCLSERYRTHLRSNTNSSCTLNQWKKRAKAQAFAELIAYIDTTLEEGIQIIWLSCNGIYENRFGVCISILA